MSVLGGLWHYGVPALLVLGCVAALVGAVREPLTPWQFSRLEAGALAVVWLVLVGDAALGDGRPTAERLWKLGVAALVALTVAFTVWRQRDARRRVRR